ncbi:MAG: acyl-CoA thioesterase [Muribaculaceae bacterium]|nr:acyl-CoA thioesterase [Muribaculaceae bacterium]
MKEPIFSMEIDVRDYELDSEGIVNNAIYLNYLEYTRHCFCQQAGLTFKQMTEQGIIPVANRIEIDYLHPLHSGDTVISSLYVEKKGVRFLFHQTLTIKGSDKVAAKAIVSIVTIENGTIGRGELLSKCFHKYL